MLEKKIMIDGKPVKFRASAAVPRMYMALTGSDIFSDIGDLMEQFHPSKQQKADRQQKAQVNLKDLSKMSVFENIAYVSRQQCAGYSGGMAGSVRHDVHLVRISANCCAVGSQPKDKCRP